MTYWRFERTDNKVLSKAFDKLVDFEDKVRVGFTTEGEVYIQVKSGISTKIYLKQIKAWLDSQNIKYKTGSHSRIFIDKSNDLELLAGMILCS